MTKKPTGGWPRGQRRNTPGRKHQAAIKRLVRALDPPVRGVRTVAVVAEDLGVSDRTVARWLSGEDWPTAESVAAILAWCVDPTAILRERVRELGKRDTAALARHLGVPKSGLFLLMRDRLDARTIRKIRRWLRE